MKVIDLSSPCVHYFTFDYKISLFAECFPSKFKKKERKESYLKDLFIFSAYSGFAS